MQQERRPREKERRGELRVECLSSSGMRTQFPLSERLHLDRGKRKMKLRKIENHRDPLRRPEERKKERFRLKKARFVTE